MGKRNKQRYIVSGANEYSFSTSNYKINRNRRHKLSQDKNGVYRMSVLGKDFQGTVIHKKQNMISVEVNGNQYDFLIDTEHSYQRRKQHRNNNIQEDFILIKSPMPGKIVGLFAEKNAVVKKGDTLLILEAMKMQNQVLAPQDGTVVSVNVKENETVFVDQVLIDLKK